MRPQKSGPIAGDPLALVLALVAAALIFWRMCWRMTWRRCFVIRDGGCRLAHALWIARAHLHNWSTMRLPRSISEPLGEVQKCGPICRGPKRKLLKGKP